MIEILFVFIFGTIIGSFLNAIIWRIHARQSIVRGRSKCVQCKHELFAGDLIPIISFLLLKGRCRYCKKPISWQYPLVEIATGILFVASYFAFHSAAPQGIVQSVFLGQNGTELLLLFRLLLFVCILLVLFVYDVRWMLLPDIVSLSAIPIAFIVNLLAFTAPDSCQDSAVVCALSIPWAGMIAAGVIGGGFFALQYWISKGTWVGGGDIRLGLLMGVMLGFPYILYALFIAYIVGAFVAVVLLVSKKGDMKTAIPFGPFLAGATIGMLLYADPVATVFRQFLNI
jgi:prepilin signal peptidase PulO-like enzyme (type II secretory pathway)